MTHSKNFWEYFDNVWKYLLGVVWKTNTEFRSKKKITFEKNNTSQEIVIIPRNEDNFVCLYKKLIRHVLFLI